MVDPRCKFNVRPALGGGMNATEGWRASWVEIVPSFEPETKFSRAINEPREPLLPFGPVEQAVARRVL